VSSATGKPSADRTRESDEQLAAFAVYLARRSPRTQSAYRRDVEALAAMAGAAPLGRLTTPQLRRFLATLHANGLSGRSLARTLSGWRAVYRFLLERESAMAEDPCAGLKAPRSPRALPSALSPDEAVHLVTMTANDPLSVRDRAMFELAYSSGLRLSEITALDVSSVDLITGEARVWGKGSKERIVPVGKPACAAIEAWLETRRVFRCADSALFVSRSGRRITPRAVQQRLAAWSIRQGLGRHVHPHMLRHSFASHVLQSSGDLRAVQELLGHASIASTQIYTHLDFQYLAKAYDSAHPRARKKPPR
jgi:integrase/recombinase XerC